MITLRKLPGISCRSWSLTLTTTMPLTGQFSAGGARPPVMVPPWGMSKLTSIFFQAFFHSNRPTTRAFHFHNANPLALRRPTSCPTRTWYGGAGPTPLAKVITFKPFLPCAGSRDTPMLLTFTPTGAAGRRPPTHQAPLKTFRMAPARSKVLFSSKSY